MPRRRHPAHRRPPLPHQMPSKLPSKSFSKASHPNREDDSEKSDGTSISQENGTDSGASESQLEMEGDIDVDAPRVAQWEPDDFEADDNSLDSDSSRSDILPDEKLAGPSQVQLKSLQSGLSNLPLGALRKAQRALALGKVISDSEENSTSEDAAGSEDEPDRKGKQTEKPEWSLKPRKDLAKRSSKHAPQEVTSKRPVTRKRIVIESKASQSRDPRFLSVAGEFSDRKFHQQYGFLADIHATELKTLRDNLKRAKKLLISSPRDLREERQQEVARLELAVKRAESNVNKDRREMVEQKALEQVEKGEKEKRKQGKGGWWMKEADKKELLLRARYDALAATGGKAAVKRAIEKKQKKIGQKEKKSRPFARERQTAGAVNSTFGKRAFPSATGAPASRPEKRRRVG